MASQEDASSSSNTNSTAGAAEGEEKAPMGNYHKLSKFMGSWPTMSIFRRFGTLNVQNILFLQAELAYLEDQLDQIRREEQTSDSTSEKSRRDTLQSFYSLSQEDEDGLYSEQYEKMIQIREKLREYNEALIQYNTLCSLHQPTKHDFNALRHWLVQPTGGDLFLQDVEGDSYDAEKVPMGDLVTMSGAHKERDAFTMFLSDNVLSWMHRFMCYWRGHGNRLSLDEENAGMHRYEDSKLNAFAHFLGTLLASLLPPLSIFVLYFVSSQVDRLCIILAFSALFSFTLALFTRSRGVEIFAATAAFASVQVVFIGTNGPA